MTTIDFDPFTAAALADPYPDFARFVDANRCSGRTSSARGWCPATRDVKHVLRRYDLFSAANALAPITPPCPAAGRALADGGFRSIPTLTNVDPPAHTRTRRIAQAAFSPRRVAAMEPFVRGLVRRFIDERLHDGRAEIVSALTWELPALVVFEILGVPAADVAVVKQGAANRLHFMFGRPAEAEQVDIATGMASFWRYCEALAEDRRRAPREDFTSDLVHTPDQAGVPLTQQEVSTILFGLLLAGHETTTNLLGNALRRLLEDPATVGRARRRSGGHPRRRRGGPALRLVRRALAPPHDSGGHAERRRAARRDGRPRVHRRGQPRPGCVRPAPTSSTSAGPTPTSTSRSAPAPTSASAPRWPASKPASCSRSSPPPCRACASTTTRRCEFVPIIGFRGPRALHVEWDQPPPPGLTEIERHDT